MNTHLWFENKCYVWLVTFGTGSIFYILYILYAWHAIYKLKKIYIIPDYFTNINLLYPIGDIKYKYDYMLYATMGFGPGSCPVISDLHSKNYNSSVSMSLFEFP